MRTTVDLSYHQDWSTFILTLELHPIRPNEDHCGPVLPLGHASLHPYIGTPPYKAKRPLYLSYHQDWSHFILTLELHPIRANEDHF